MKKLALVLIATVFSAGAFAQVAATSTAPEAGANPVSTHQTVERKHPRHHHKHRTVRAAR